MCGIAGYACFGAARPTLGEVKPLWDAQESRGRDASGYAYISEALETRYWKEPVKVTDLSDRVQWNDILASPVAIFHARAKTQGSEKEEVNNHPVLACGWAIVHNGVIGNDDTLWNHLKDKASQARPGQVDTSAINLVLEQGKASEADEIGSIGTLSGSVVLAGWRLDNPLRVLVARSSGSELNLMVDQERKIVFWSSADTGFKGLRHFSLVGLTFQSAAKMPFDHALVLDVEQKQIRRYTFDKKAFNNYGGQIHSPLAPRKAIGGISTGIQKIGTDSRGFEVMEHYGKQGLDKPFPLFTGLSAAALNPIKPPASIELVNVATPYGTWFLTPTTLNFRAHKRIREYWGELGFVGVPVAEEWAKIVDDDAKVEMVRWHDGKDITLVYMCPWCGNIQTFNTWHQEYKMRCGWCQIRSKAS